MSVFLLLACVALAKAPPALREPTSVEVERPGDVAITWGVVHYPKLGREDPFAARDSELFADLFRDTLGVPDHRIIRLDDATTVDQAREAFDAALNLLEPGGTLWLHFSGNGRWLDDSGCLGLLPAEVSGEPGGIMSGALPLDELASLVEDSHAGFAVFVIDASAGAVDRGGCPLVRDVPAIAPTDSQRNGPRETSSKVLIWYGAAPGETARLYPAAGYGLFSYWSAGALRGWADGATSSERDGSVTIAEAQIYVQRALLALGAREQHPSRIWAEWAQLGELSRGAERGPRLGSLDPLPESLGCDTTWRAEKELLAVDLRAGERPRAIEGWTGLEETRVTERWGLHKDALSDSASERGRGPFVVGVPLPETASHDFRLELTISVIPEPARELPRAGVTISIAGVEATVGAWGGRATMEGMESSRRHELDARGPHDVALDRRGERCALWLDDALVREGSCSPAGMPDHVVIGLHDGEGTAAVALQSLRLFVPEGERGGVTGR